MSDVPTAGECMSKPLLILQPQEDVFTAIATLTAKGYSGAPVVDEDNRLVGILTDKDCLRTVSSSVYEEGLHGGKVSDYMSPVKATVDANMDLFAVAHCFLKTNFVVLPVLQQGKLIGRISRRDVLRGIQRWQHHDADKKRRELQAMEEGQKRPSSIEKMQKMVAEHKKEHVAEAFRKSDG